VRSSVTGRDDSGRNGQRQSIERYRAAVVSNR
jgi:hypothetical protein